MESIASSRYQYVKFPQTKLCNNQWGVHVANEKQLEENKQSDVKGNTTLPYQIMEKDQETRGTTSSSGGRSASIDRIPSV